MLSDTDAKFLRIAYDEAKAGYDEGGWPIGSVLARGDTLVSQGRNQRVQGGDPIAHGEMDCLRKAGRQKSYKGMTLYTSLSPFSHHPFCFFRFVLFFFCLAAGSSDRGGCVCSQRFTCI